MKNNITSNVNKATSFKNMDDNVSCNKIQYPVTRSVNKVTS